MQASYLTVGWFILNDPHFPGFFGFCHFHQNFGTVGFFVGAKCGKRRWSTHKKTRSFRVPDWTTLTVKMWGSLQITPKKNRVFFLARRVKDVACGKMLFSFQFWTEYPPQNLSIHTSNSIRAQMHQELWPLLVAICPNRKFRQHLFQPKSTIIYYITELAIYV